MVAEPTYPDDAPVGKPVEEPQPEAKESDEADAEKAPETKRTRHIVAGAAIGIGSAALVAALLYANRSRGGKNEGNK